MDWNGRKVLVTGGASFIGSHLVDALVARGARVRVVDNLSSGQEANLAPHVASGAVELVRADLSEPEVAPRVVKDMSVVFHLAADHGGRGYVDLHQAACAANMALDGMVFQAPASSSISPRTWWGRPTTPTTCTAGPSSWAR